MNIKQTAALALGVLVSLLLGTSLACLEDQVSEVNHNVISGFDQVMEKLESLEDQINELKNCSCSAATELEEPSSNYVAVGCKNTTVTVTNQNYYLADANHGSWPGDGFCKVWDPSLLNSGVYNSYEISAELYNNMGWAGVNSGHLGFMYNMQDINNYDVVYFRIHISTSSLCVQLGYVANGAAFTGTTQHNCASRPTGQTWFNAKVTVSGSSASIYLQGSLVTTTTPYFPSYRRGGVLVANGYQNVVFFRNLLIQ